MATKDNYICLSESLHKILPELAIVTRDDTSAPFPTIPIDDNINDGDEIDADDADDDEDSHSEPESEDSLDDPVDVSLLVFNILFNTLLCY